MGDEWFVCQKFADHAAKHLTRGHTPLAGDGLQLLRLPTRQKQG